MRLFFVFEIRSIKMMKFIFGLLLFHTGVEAAKRYYASEQCGHVVGPDQLSVIEFDEEVDYDKRAPSTEQDLKPPKKLRNTVWECIIIVRGMPSAIVERWIGIHWREFHIWDQDLETTGESVEECGKAYVTIYRGADTSATQKWTLCGKDTTRLYFEWPGDYVTFYIYADFRRNASYSTPSTTTTTTTTTLPTCIDPDDVEEGSVTNLPLCTTPRGRRRNGGDEVTTTTEEPDLDMYPYPEVHFRVDITSFDFACNESIEGEILKCNFSQRCLDESLMCDFFFSQNCRSVGFHEDKTDQTKDAPAYCGTKKTTTPIPTTTTEAFVEPFDWTPIAAGAGGVLAILAFCWCCWRPGYLPWRLSRLRNFPLFNTKKCICCKRGPTQCCPCLKCCAGDGSDDTYFVGTVGGAGAWSGSGIGGGGKKKRSVGGHPFGQSGLNISNAPYRMFDNPSLGAGKFDNSVKPTNGYVPFGSPVNGYGQDPDNFATDWLKFITADGAHLREQR